MEDQKVEKKNKIDNSFLKKKVKKIDKSNYNILDIGSGYGESSIELAKNDQKNIVISCEKYIDGLNSIFEKSENELLDNIFIFQGNVHQLIDEYLPEKSISEVWILFPDPWPKKRHFKRRLINRDFLKKISRYLKSKATIHIASDSKSYIYQILNAVYDVKNQYLWVNQTKQEWDYNIETLPETKYFKKALKNGLNPFYIKLKKL